MRRWLRWTVALAAAAAAACGGDGAPRRGPFRAVWVAADSAPPGRAELTRLAAAGAGELFLEAGRLGWDGDRVRLEARELGPLARETPATLVVVGRWSATPESPRRVAESWSERLEGLSLATRAAGAVPVGVHFDLDIAADADALADTLRRVRSRLRGRLVVSVGIDDEALGLEATRELASSVDYFVAPVFGQPPSAADDPALWDLARSRRRLAALDALGALYAAAGWSLGRAELIRRGGAAESLAGAVPLARLLRSPRFTIRPGAVFSGVDRQVLAVEARERTALGPWTFERGDAVRVARPTTHDLEELLEAAAPRPQGPRIGVVLRALPAASDAVSPGATSLAAAFEPGSAAPALELALVPLGSRRGWYRFAVRLANGNAEPTDLGGGEWNYVELKFPEGALGAVEAGDFVGWEQLWRGQEKRTLRALRRADTLRLFVPYVGAGETLESGAIELRDGGGGRPEVTASGRFLLPGGREHSLPSQPARWIAGDRTGRTE